MVSEYKRHYHGQLNQDIDTLSSVGFHLSALSSLPKLEEMGVHVENDYGGYGFEIRFDHNVVADFIRGCSKYRD